MWCIRLGAGRRGDGKCMTCSESPDVLSGDSYNRSGDEVRNAGLYVDVAPWTCHVL
jgi:hypothetical protein